MHRAALAPKAPLATPCLRHAACTPAQPPFRPFSPALRTTGPLPLPLRLQASGSSTEPQPSGSTSSVDETTQKFGLEAGLWQVFASKDSGDGKSKSQQAKDLLKRYGSAYLITSISFAIVSFAACYALVVSGVDVGALLARVGLKVTDTSEKVGTFAIAYAAHKALSPVRFPPTVALTPVVARALGKDVGATVSSADGEDARV